MLMLISEIDISTLGEHGHLIVLFLKETIDWCLSKVNTTSDSCMMLMIDSIGSIYNKNSNYINQNSPNFKNHKIIEAYNKRISKNSFS
jgi:hypothetical protein